MVEPSPSTVAAEAAVWGLIEAEAKKRKDDARAWLADRMGPDLLAVKAIANGQDVGRATYVEGKAAYKVTDSAAFLEHVRETYPTELIEAPNPAWLKTYLTQLASVGDCIVDSNGLPVTGVELRHGNPHVTVSKSKDARAKVQQLLVGGRLTLDGIEASNEAEVAS